MEAIGRLAGGVAHDFNNLLTGIAGYTELLGLSLEDNDALLEYIEQISKATDRATDLIGKLMAFSRKQVIEPQIININSIVSESQNMIGRIIGEDIELDVIPKQGLPNVKSDPGQIDQILLNLVVNARDAMPDGGKLIIRTDGVVIDEEFCRLNFEVEPGEYVILSVSDSGIGMDEYTKTQVFEPFFTTKKEGKGTGLGLSTVYGIVKQNKGFVNVDSEIDVGTTISVYLPCVYEKIKSAQQEPGEEVPRGSAIVLLVEDEEILRNLAKSILEKQGYKVLEAKDAEEAFSIFMRCRDNVDLLLTDLVMPGISGKQLADQLKPILPNMRILFMSGYSEEVVDNYGIMKEGVNFIKKPFGCEDLARKVHEVMNEAKV